MVWGGGIVEAENIKVEWMAVGGVGRRGVCEVECRV